MHLTSSIIGLFLATSRLAAALPQPGLNVQITVQVSTLFDKVFNTASHHSVFNSNSTDFVQKMQPGDRAKRDPRTMYSTPKRQPTETLPKTCASPTTMFITSKGTIWPHCLLRASRLYHPAACYMQTRSVTHLLAYPPPLKKVI